MRPPVSSSSSARFARESVRPRIVRASVVEHVQTAPVSPLRFARTINAAHRDFAPSISAEIRADGAFVLAGNLSVAPGGRIAGQLAESYPKNGHVRLAGIAIPIRVDRFEIHGLPAGDYEVSGPQIGCLGTSVSVKAMPGQTTLAVIEHP
jgi:hypothetical protein